MELNDSGERKMMSSPGRRMEAKSKSLKTRSQSLIFKLNRSHSSDMYALTLKSKGNNNISSYIGSGSRFRIEEQVELDFPFCGESARILQLVSASTSSVMLPDAWNKWSHKISCLYGI